MAMISLQVFYLAILVFCLSQAHGSEPVQEPGEQGPVSSQDLPECGLYLAVSSTSTVDEPKWGTFAGNTIPKDGSIGSGEVGIQAFQLKEHITDVNDSNAANELRKDIVDFLEEFIWVPQNSGGQFELVQGKKVVTAVPGVGVVGGCKFLPEQVDLFHDTC